MHTNLDIRSRVSSESIDVVADSSQQWPDDVIKPKTVQTHLYASASEIDSVLSYLNSNLITDIPQSIETLNRIKESSEHFGYEFGIIKYYKMIHEIATNTGESNDHLHALENLFKDPRFTFTDEEINSLKLTRASIYYHQNQLDESMDALQQIDQSSSNELTLGSLYATKGFINHRRGVYDEAIEDFGLALEHLHSTGDIKTQIQVLSAIAATLEINGRYDESLRYYERSLDLLTPSLSVSRYAYQIHSGMGILYRYMEDLERSDSSQLKALELARELQNTDYEARSLLNLGNLYLSKKNYEQALDYFTKSLQICRQEGIEFGIYINFVNIATVQAESNRYEESLAAYDSALVYSEKFKSPHELSQLYRGMSDVHQRMGNYKEQADFLYKSMKLKEELFDSEVDAAIENLRVDYETKLKDQEIALKKAEIAVISSEKKSVIVWSLFGLTFFLIAVMTLVYRNRVLYSLYKRNIELFHQAAPTHDTVTLHPEDKKGQFKKLYLEIIDLIEREKIYQNEDLSLNLLAERTGSNYKYVSQTISMYSDKTFHQLINFYRINQARKQIIEREQDVQMKEIMFDCGFRSRSTFNHAFKDFTGMTPTQFKIMVNKERTNF